MVLAKVRRWRWLFIAALVGALIVGALSCRREKKQNERDLGQRTIEIVPEPPSLLLLGSGSAVLAYLLRRGLRKRLKD